MIHNNESTSQIVVVPTETRAPIFPRHTQPPHICIYINMNETLCIAVVFYVRLSVTPIHPIVFKPVCRIWCMYVPAREKSEKEGFFGLIYSFSTARHIHTHDMMGETVLLSYTVADDVT